MDKITRFLKDNREEKFKAFQVRLIPTIDAESVVGVRTPALKALAKELIKTGEAEEFLQELPHKYFEENQLHAFILSELKGYDRVLFETNRFLPYIDNWATCDQLIPKAFGKNSDRVICEVEAWLQSKDTYTVRFGIGILMRYFLDDKFDEKYLARVAEIKSDEYYINMMSAWFFATALAKQYDKTLPYLLEKKLDKWVHNKTISKACESFRVKVEHKEYLKELLIKKMHTN